jgi:hypothetical protein
MRAMWRDGSATFTGEHYTVTRPLGTPVPDDAGRPAVGDRRGEPAHPDAGRPYADIVSIVPSLAAGHIGAEVAAESVVEKYADRVRWAREAAGERAGELEFQCWTAAVQVVPTAPRSSSLARPCST